MRLTPDEHAEWAERLLTEAAERVAQVGADVNSPTWDARMRRAELCASRATAHALLAGLPDRTGDRGPA